MNLSRPHDLQINRLRCPFAFVVLLAGCSLLTPHPALLRRYKTVASSSAAPPVAMSIGISSLPVEPAGAPQLKDLSNQAQSAYIQQLGRMIKEPDKLRSSIAAPMEAEHGNSAFEDRLEFSRRLVITVARDDLDPANYRPADRLVWTKVTIKPRGDCLHFLSWSLAQTEYTSLDIGTLTNSQNRTLGGQLGVTAQGIPVPVSAQVNLSTQNTLSEELALRQRVEALTPVLRPDQIEIIREGFAGADLTGNTIFDVKMIYDKSAKDCSTTEDLFVTAARLFDGKGAPLSAAKASIAEHSVRVVAEQKSLEADIGLQCTARRVVSGDATIDEGDDIVAFQHCTLSPSSTPQVLIPSEALSTTIWILQNTTEPHNKLAIRDDTNAEFHPLYFESRAVADEVRRWLQVTRNGSIGRHQTLGLVGLQFYPLSSRHYPLLEVVRYQ